MTELTTRELSADTWSDLAQVLGERGGAQGCWCMHWRVSFAEWKENQGEGNRQALRRRASESPPAGLIGYLDGHPVGWIAVGEREEYPRMGRSPVMRPIDDARGWIVSCVFVHPDRRGEGLPVALIQGACNLAERWEQEVIDAVPVDLPDGRRAGPDTAMTGIATSFSAAGFRVIARPKRDRPLMRRRLRNR